MAPAGGPGARGGPGGGPGPGRGRGPGGGPVVWPLPGSAREMAAQAARAVRRARLDGAARQSVRWLLPVGVRAGPGPGAFLSTASGGGAVNLRAEFESACALTTALLELDRQGAGPASGGGGAGVRGRRLDDSDDSEPVALLRSPAGRLSAVVFPTPETLGRVRELAAEDARRTLILADPQWTERGNLLSDFGFGTRRERDEAFVRSFQEVYSLTERRVGNTTEGFGLPLGSRQGAVVRLLRCYPGAWQVHVMGPSRQFQEGTRQFLQDRDSKFLPAGEQATREPIAVFDQYPSYSELQEAVQGYMDRRLRSWWTLGESAAGGGGRPRWAGAGAGAGGGGGDLPPSAGGASSSSDRERGGAGASAAEPPVFGDQEVALMDDPQMLRAALEAARRGGTGHAGRRPGGEAGTDDGGASGGDEPGEDSGGGDDDVERLRQHLKTTQQVRLMQKPGASIAKVLRTTQSRCRVCNRKLTEVKQEPARLPCPECTSRGGARDFDCPVCGGWGYTICPACLPLTSPAGERAEGGGG